jgi:sterol desaturase/sphingolipid hydroxylase (fatty acid hydroxylase superfamily)
MTRTSRAELRAELMSRVPRSYSPWLHLLVPALVGIGAAGFALSRVEALRAWQLLSVPAFLVFGNAVEWWVHRRILHRRTRPVEVFYVRHTPQHHAVYVADDMAIRSLAELKLVLLPAYAILGILALTSPITAAFVLLGHPNLAALWVASAVFYLLAYEWLHLAYHLPESSRIGRARLVRTLRRHHQLHHAPQLMQRWNFNVTLPLWDWVRGTLHPPADVSSRAATAANGRGS